MEMSFFFFFFNIAEQNILVLYLFGSSVVVTWVNCVLVDFDECDQLFSRNTGRLSLIASSPCEAESGVDRTSEMAGVLPGLL
jgi:hypothetical protein